MTLERQREVSEHFKRLLIDNNFEDYELVQIYIDIWHGLYSRDNDTKYLLLNILSYEIFQRFAHNVLNVKESGEMALGHLNEFNKFDFKAFSFGKRFEVTAIRPWEEFKDGEKTGNVLGLKYDCIITEDKTKYRLKEGEEFTNRYAGISFKIPNAKDTKIKIGMIVDPVDPVAIIYGQYRNSLSVTCKGFNVDGKTII